MSINRVQKLLLSEYCDFEDMVLIESPFAQTTKEGNGLRQVHLGLTPSKLILATDILPPIDSENFDFSPLVDPEIETFELIAIYPVECVTLSVYRRKRRQALKARFCNNRVLYFELGGFERRGMFWNLWCEKVKFLCPTDSASSRSETSVATSTTGSSLYLLEKKVVSVSGMRQLWYRFGPTFGVDTHFINQVLNANNNCLSLTKKWTDRYLFLGKGFQSSDQQIECADECSERKKNLRYICKRRSHAPLIEEKRLNFGDKVHVNRFGSGVQEGCRTGLYLSLDSYISPVTYSSAVRSLASDQSLEWPLMNYEELAETAVMLWEFYGFEDETRCKQGNLINMFASHSFCRFKHRRRYGFAPKPWFLYGFGPETLSKGDKFSLQIKRASSEVYLRPPDSPTGLKLSVSKRQLTATVSCPHIDDLGKSASNNIVNCHKKPLILFWTPNYWYRPVSAKDAYQELQAHLTKIRECRETQCKHRISCIGRQKFNGKFLKRNRVKGKETDEDDEDFGTRRNKRKPNFIANIFGAKIDEVPKAGESRQPNESSFQYLKRVLRLEVKLKAWDFDSTTLAHQITLIDKELFLKVSASELEVLVWQQNCRNAPNVAAIVAFSYRIGCLISTEILKDDSERVRARLVARFINVANKCHRISNFQSCRSVLSGLQSPAIFRLRKTWAYVRKKHASKYQVFEFLCRLYRDPRMPSYQKTFFIFSQSAPFLPYIGHVIGKLLDKIPEYRINVFKRQPSRPDSYSASTSTSSKTEIHETLDTGKSIFAKIFNAFTTHVDRTENGVGDVAKHRNKAKKSPSVKYIKFKGLYEYYKPWEFYEDNRPETLLEAVKLLEKCQLAAINYSFSCDEAARNFLLKTRHYDDQDNFFYSFKVEATESNIVNDKVKVLTK
ncbi:uncharacterized protein LOC132705099 [Cylas formicarius]|uniref:uncharacterized protein LOC132705099 n=1 Tax=Cylas formicarius TaxID=197179 RepID=UPI002958DDD6|nr:uncharacterized protein LOC132705099 [Cylas formicarius]